MFRAVVLKAIVKPSPSMDAPVTGRSAGWKTPPAKTWRLTRNVLGSKSS